MSGECEKCGEHCIDCTCNASLKRSIPDYIDIFLLSLTDQEFELFSEILGWGDEKKIAFMMAKRIFEHDKDENGF